MATEEVVSANEVVEMIQRPHFIDTFDVNRQTPRLAAFTWYLRLQLIAPLLDALWRGLVRLSVTTATVQI
jgi:hypothetical protein